MHLIRHQDQGSIKQPDAIRLSIVRSTSSTSVCHDFEVVDTMKVLVNYAGTFELEHGGKFADGSIKNILDDMLSSEHRTSRK